MKPASIWDWLGPFVLFAIFLSYLYVSASSEFSLCDGDNCFREWFAALSGWVALGAAYVSLSTLREQVSDQRRQTDYIIGNMPPEMTAETRIREDDQVYYQTVRITIKNRNRRPVRVFSVKFLGDERVKIGVFRTAIDNDSEPKIFGGMYTDPYVHRVLPGKEDGEPAPKCVIDCHVFWNGEIRTLDRNPDFWTEISGKITADTFVLEQSERLVTLEQQIVFDA